MMLYEGSGSCFQSRWKDLPIHKIAAFVSMGDQNTEELKGLHMPRYYRDVPIRKEWRVSIERSAVILMGIPLCVFVAFSLAAFNICSLCLIFLSLINMCLGVSHLGFILFGTLWVSWTWVANSFPILGKFSTIISSDIFSCPSFLSSSSGTPMIWMLEHLTLS